MDESNYRHALEMAIEAEYAGKSRRHGLSVFKAGWNGARGIGSSLNPFLLSRNPLPNRFGYGRIWDAGYKAYRTWEAKRLSEFARLDIEFMEKYMLGDSFEQVSSAMQRAIVLGWRPDWTLCREELGKQAQDVIRRRIEERRKQLLS